MGVGSDRKPLGEAQDEGIRHGEKSLDPPIFDISTILPVVFWGA